MKRSTRLTTWVVAAIMAMTCFVPVSDIAFATEGDQQATTQTATQTTTRPTDPYANKTGWVSKGAYRYYYNRGYPIKGIRKVGKIWYEFNKVSGVLMRTIGDDMDRKAQYYSSRKNYLILVNYKNHKVRVYKGKKNRWTRVKNFTCTLGKRSTRTPRGTFSVGRKGKYFNTGGGARCWYWTGFIGTTYLFHSVLYNRNKRPTKIIDGRLGRNLSHGCIRLSLSNAKWIYKYVPRKTKVVIY